MKRATLLRPAIAIVGCLVFTALAAVVLAACGGDAGQDESPPPAAGSGLAPGLYDLEDGTVLALGVVEYRDLEGGFWAVVDRTVEGGGEDVVAVLVNGDQFADRFREEQGSSFEVYGTRAGDASVRMAGPEIVADRVVLAPAGGPAE